MCNENRERHDSTEDGFLWMLLRLKKPLLLLEKRMTVAFFESSTIYYIGVLESDRFCGLVYFLGGNCKARDLGQWAWHDVQVVFQKGGFE